jgi:hypothetical protein
MLLYDLRRSWSLWPLERPSTEVSARAVHPCRLSFRSGLDETRHVALTDGSVNLPAVASVRSARPCRPPVPFARGSVNPPPVASVRSVRPCRPAEPSVRAACPSFQCTCAVLEHSARPYSARSRRASMCLLVVRCDRTVQACRP